MIFGATFINLIISALINRKIYIKMKPKFLDHPQNTYYTINYSHKPSIRRQTVNIILIYIVNITPRLTGWDVVTAQAYEKHMPEGCNRALRLPTEHFFVSFNNHSNIIVTNRSLVTPKLNNSQHIRSDEKAVMVNHGQTVLSSQPICPFRFVPVPQFPVDFYYYNILGYFFAQFVHTCNQIDPSSVFRLKKKKKCAN